MNGPNNVITTPAIRKYERQKKEIFHNRGQKTKKWSLFKEKTKQKGIPE